ncbi:MAG TPA: flap endonuclease-1 [Conexivisphaerales archaeon]|nr:flap endonuclease-1 [Conexivisphaerales archaeon]
MGVDLGPLVKERATIRLEDLNRRIIAIDAYNALYQFLAVIRGETGEPLMDREGRVTSHLSGLFYRTCNFLEKGARPLYVFDGKPPQLKHEEISRRGEAKRKAYELYQEAQVRGDAEGMRKYGSLSVRLDEGMVAESKELLKLMGLPVVQAPSEGECEAAYLASVGKAWASVSQDYDSLLFGSPRLIRNLTVSGRRKLPGRDIYIEVIPEMVKLEDVLRELSVDHAQLVDLGILLGTDFNPDGFKGVGTATALKYIHTYGSLDRVEPLKDEIAGTDYQQIRDIFLKPAVADVGELEWGEIDLDGLKSMLCDRHDFSPERVQAAVVRVREASKGRSETLERWFG